MNIIRFTHPQYLLLLPVVWAFTWWVLRGSLADLGTARARFSTGLRVLLLTLLILALAGIQFVRRTETLCTVFAVDASDSIGPTQQQQALTYIRQALRQKRAGDQAVVVAFGADALLDQMPANEREMVDRIVSTPNRTRTDISAGIQLAMASFPQESGKQVILFSDGNENLGNAADQASLALSNEVRISTIPLERDTLRSEALLLRAEAPQEVKQGAPFQVSVVAEATQPVTGTITLKRDTTSVATRRISLKPGKTVIGFEDSVPKSGMYQYTAVLNADPAHDTLPDNNLAYAFTRVAGKPRVLVIEGTPGDGRSLAHALQANDLEVVLAGPERIPATLAACTQYESLIFANVPAWRMSPTQMTIIRSAVRDTGMGFAMVGGPESFGAGGYYHTPIEEALPVSMDVKKQKQLPSLTLVIVIDISGSMTIPEDGVPKIRIAAEAAAAAVELLQPMDQVCVIGFDTSAVYNVKMTTIGNGKGRIISQIERLEAGGGGIMTCDALEEAYKVIKPTGTRIKHVILCADAQDTEQHEGCLDVIKDMKRDKITLSVIGFGTPHDPDVPFHKEMARVANGTSYLAERMSNLPAIFTRDVLATAKPLLIEEPFRAQPRNTAHPIMQGIGCDTAPPLLGYVATSMKGSMATEILATKKDDPLLAAWPYGLGRSIAFTSDASAHWGVHWLNWPQYPAFWAQSLRWTVRRSGASGFQTAVTEHNGQATISVDAVTSQGEFRNQLDLRAHIAHVQPGGIIGGTATAEEVPLRQTAPGQYEAVFDVRKTGAYVVTVEEREGNRTKGLQRATLVIPYSPEFQSVKPNRALLAEIARRAGGALLSLAHPEDIYGKLRFGSRRLRDLWPLLMCLLALLFLLDVAVRRLMLPWDELWKIVRDAIVGRLPAPQPATAGGAPRPKTGTIGSLLGTKSRVRESGRPATSPAPDASRPSFSTIAPPPTTPADTATADTPPALTPPAPAAPSTTAGRLLQKKRERKGE